MLLYLIAFLFFTVVYFTLDAKHDSSLQKWRAARLQSDIEKYSRQWHVLDAFIKGMVGAFISWLIWGFSITGGQFLILFLIIRWIWFDAALNRFNGLPISYLGSTAFLDRIFKSVGLQYFVKMLLLFGVIASLFLW